MSAPEQIRHLLFTIEVRKRSEVIMFVVDSGELLRQCRGGPAGQQRLKIGLSRYFLLLQSLQCFASFL